MGTPQYDKKGGTLTNAAVVVRNQQRHPGDIFICMQTQPPLARKPYTLHSLSQSIIFMSFGTMQTAQAGL